MAERVFERHVAVEAAIEVFWQIAAEPARRIAHQSFGRSDVFIEGDRIKERLQRRTGRAHSARHINIAAGAIAASAADARAYGAAIDLDGEYGNLRVPLEFRRTAAHECFKVALQGRIQRRADNTFAGILLRQCVGSVWG